MLKKSKLEGTRAPWNTVSQSITRALRARLQEFHVVEDMRLSHNALKTYVKTQNICKNRGRVNLRFPVLLSP